VKDGALVGYLALTTKEDVAQVARLAVHPDWNSHGIGRQLLIDGLLAAVELGCHSAVLNTQAANQRAQILYRSLGFHPTGDHFEVYTRQAAG
jgi:[ribosomal protein S18]-alanine N-acetyltransferase